MPNFLGNRAPSSSPLGEYTPQRRCPFFSFKLFKWSPKKEEGPGVSRQGNFLLQNLKSTKEKSLDLHLLVLFNLKHDELCTFAAKFIHFDQR